MAKAIKVGHVTRVPKSLMWISKNGDVMAKKMGK